MPTLAVLDHQMLRAGPAVPAITRLGGGAIATAGEGQPWRVIGLDAAVYQLRQPSGRVIALRCPLSDTFERSYPDRYRALAADPGLRPLRDHPDSPFPGEIVFLPDGLALPAKELRSAPHPVIASEWVMGPTELQAADRACRDGDSGTLRALADAWLAVVEAIATHAFVHGDLSADNALVRPGGGLALVDYDAATWRGSPPFPSAATANPNYAHPTGRPAPSPEGRDRFAALVVLASLRALAERPELRPQFGDPTTEPGGSLLFSPWDLVDPARSAVFAALVGLESETSALVRALRSACTGRADATPALRDLVARAAVGRRGAAPAASDRGEASGRLGGPDRHRTRDRKLAPSSGAIRDRQAKITRLNGLIMTGDDDGALRFWRSSGLGDDPDVVRDYGIKLAELEARAAGRSPAASPTADDPASSWSHWDARSPERDDASALPPLPFQSPVAAAQRRAGQVERLQRALDARDMATVATLWPELRRDPLAVALAIRVTDALRSVMGQTIAEAGARGDDAALLEAIGDAEEAGVPIDAAARRAARAAVTRIETRRRLQEAIAADDRTTLTDLVLSGRLAELGSVDRATAQAAMRALHWPLLEAALQGSDDQRIMSAYDAEPDLFEGAAVLTREQRTRVDLARSRIYWLNEVRIALRNRDAKTLHLALPAAPPGVTEQLSEVERRRIDRLTTKDDAVVRLARALKEGPDRAIVEALAAVKASGAALPEVLDWAAVRGVEDRVSLADALRDAAAAQPPDYARLAILLPAARAAAREAGAGSGADFTDGLDFEQLEADVLHAAHVSRLREAIASDDDAAIAAAADPDPDGVIVALTPPQRARVERALQAQRAGRQMARRGLTSLTPLPPLPSAGEGDSCGLKTAWAGGRRSGPMGRDQRPPSPSDRRGG